MLKDLRAAPNQLTFLRLCIIPFLVTAVLDGRYRTAFALFILAGISDGLDGLLARILHQRTRLGEYLDPVADKLLLSTLFLGLMHQGLISRRVTILVFSRDVGIVVVGALLFATTGARDFRPSIFGKANTFAQIAAVFFVLLLEVHNAPWIAISRRFFLRATFTFTIVSALHYVLLVGQRLRTHPSVLPPASSSVPI